MTAKPSRQLDELRPLLRPTPRRARIGEDCGDLFAEDDNFDGFTLTIELHDAQEAEALAAALPAIFPSWKVTRDV